MPRLNPQGGRCLNALAGAATDLVSLRYASQVKDFGSLKPDEITTLEWISWMIIKRANFLFFSFFISDIYR